MKSKKRGGINSESLGVILFIGFLIVLIALQSSNFSISGYTVQETHEINTVFPIDAWEYTGWGKCTGQTGSWEKVNDYCQYKGYTGALPANENPCYHIWNQDRWRWNGKAPMTKGEKTWSGFAFTKIKCFSGPPPCTDYCSSSGTKVCATSTQYKTCGNYDSDDCLEWSSVTSCSSGYTCQNGNCKPPCTNECPYSGKKECTSTTRYKTCGYYGSSCLKWSGSGSCPSGKTCSGGQCITSCTNECTPYGKRECTSSTRYKTCGYYDSDSCLDWSSISSCYSGTTCSGGICSSSPSCTDECPYSGKTKTCGRNYDSDNCLEWSS